MPAPVTPTPIVAYSGSLPDPSDPSTYGTRGRAFWSWEVGDLYNGINLIAGQTFTNAQAAAESAESATMTAGAAMWNAATNYTTGQNAISPTDMQTYRRNSPGGVDATDPAASALWTLVGDKFLRKAGDTVTGNLQMSAGAGYITASANMNGHPSHTSSLAQHTPILRNLTTNASTLAGAVANGSGASAGYYAKLDPVVSSRWGGLIVSDTGTRIHSSASNNAVAATNVFFTFKGVDMSWVQPDGVYAGYGIRCRQGTSGGTLSNVVNLFWTGTQLEVWVDTTRIGTVNITP